ncbi:zinc finger and BTB domain-containing protein 41-like [Phlebotomus argentipes]|uniref:zinc finger and BTB domain-containing protein 41-like n=1 Tax=Phlebotomus argentipes TaxID=94469 RepID=UPI0028929DE7|nr:zinc finger and BTB domain-containing protein 41-like [Phlebotomus argentipes]
MERKIVVKQEKHCPDYYSGTYEHEKQSFDCEMAKEEYEMEELTTPDSKTTSASKHSNPLIEDDDIASFKIIRPEQHKCENCNKTFSTKTCLDNHMKPQDCFQYQKNDEGMQNVQNDETYETAECESCNLTFKNKTALEMHLKIRCSASCLSKYASCDICKKIFKCKYSLDTHRKSHFYVHSVYSSKGCPNCNKIRMIRGVVKQNCTEKCVKGYLGSIRTCRVCKVFFRSRERKSQAETNTLDKCFKCISEA